MTVLRACEVYGWILWKPVARMQPQLPGMQPSNKPGLIALSTGEAPDATCGLQAGRRCSAGLQRRQHRVRPA